MSLKLKITNSNRKYLSIEVLFISIMFDQSFSYLNFRTIFSIELRKGHIDLNRMPQKYKDAVADIKWLNEEIAKLKRKKRGLWTEAEAKDYKDDMDLLKVVRDEKEECLTNHLQQIADKVNAHGFNFTMTKSLFENKEVFSVDSTDWAQFFVMKCLIRNVAKSFNVEMVNRHTVMMNLKLLMNNHMPVFIIRTDVSSFFESIPQKRMMELIERNSVLSMKSKDMVKRCTSSIEEEKSNVAAEYVFYNYCMGGVAFFILVWMFFLYRALFVDHVYFSGWISFLPYYLPVPLIAALLWVLIVQKNRANKLSITISEELFRVRYLEGLLLMVNKLFKNSDTSIARINKAIDAMVDSYLHQTERMFLNEDKIGTIEKEEVNANKLMQWMDKLIDKV